MTEQEAYAIIAKHLATGSKVLDWSDWQELDDGRALRGRLMFDTEVDPFEDYDCYGRVAAIKYDRTRPETFTGAARKLATRGGPIWWQPPADVLNDPVALEACTKHVQNYLLEYWYFAQVDVEIQSKACPCCGNRQVTRVGSIGGVESDTDEAGFADYVQDIVNSQ